MSANIGKKIKSIREKNNLSQSRFGLKIGVSGKTVSAYETERSFPSLKVMDSITKVYNVHIVGSELNLNQRIQNIQKEFEELKAILTF